MRVYTVHAPKTAVANPRAAGERVVFVRDGFHVWAFVFGPFWLLAHRLWWALAGYVAVSVVLSVVMALLRAGSGTNLCVMLLLALLLGLEAATLRRWTLSRGKWHQIDLVAASNEQEAERRFFERWTLRQGNSGDDPGAVERGGPPPTRDIPGQPFSRPPPSPPSIVGLFPQPGGSA